MLGIYFSGTGNSKYALTYFITKYDPNGEIISIENKEVIEKISDNNEITFCFPVYYSSLPKIVKDFVADHPSVWQGKRIFVIATMGLFSGDGAGCLARLLKKHGAVIVGGLHLKMPDCIGDVKALKRPLHVNVQLVKEAEIKIDRAVENLKQGKAPQEGIGFVYHLGGLFGQRLYFYNKTRNYTDKLKIDSQKCIGCGQCAELCPMSNIQFIHQKPVSGARCTMCYRCINYCPKQAITLLGKEIIEQSRIEKYIEL